ncbi:MAG: hypothetical protein ABW101_02185 [Candidatus Thiodiazotropha sp.]
MDTITNQYAYYDAQILLSNRIDEKQALYSIPHNLRNGNHTQSKTETQIPGSAFVSNIVSPSCNVVDLNLILRHIDSIVIKHINLSIPPANAESGNNQIYNKLTNDYEQNTSSIPVDNGQDNNGIRILISIHEYIQSNELVNQYKLYCVHNHNCTTSNIIEYLVMLVPYDQGVPSPGMACYFSLSSTGAIRKSHLSIESTRSGYLYNNDWVYISKVSVIGSLLNAVTLSTYRNDILDGYCLYSSSDLNRELNDEYIYIDGFNDIWYTNNA